jgi:hypothetical protein
LSWPGVGNPTDGLSWWNLKWRDQEKYDKSASPAPQDSTQTCCQVCHDCGDSLHFTHCAYNFRHNGDGDESLRGHHVRYAVSNDHNDYVDYDWWFYYYDYYFDYDYHHNADHNHHHDPNPDHDHIDDGSPGQCVPNTSYSRPRLQR